MLAGCPIDSYVIRRKAKWADRKTPLKGINIIGVAKVLAAQKRSDLFTYKAEPPRMATASGQFSSENQNPQVNYLVRYQFALSLPPMCYYIITVHYLKSWCLFPLHLHIYKEASFFKVYSNAYLFHEVSLPDPSKWMRSCPSLSLPRHGFFQTAFTTRWYTFSVCFFF